MNDWMDGWVMPQINEEILSRAAAGDPAALSELDSCGFLAAPGEELSDFLSRTKEVLAQLEEFNTELAQKGEIEIPDVPKLSSEKLINQEILEESALLTDNAYGFKINWVPGFFLSESLGFLWGGCAISFHDNRLTLFLIRASFAKKIRWLIYRRDELLSHELCHIARMPLNDNAFEEFFAYRLSPSWFRRYFAPCFHTQADSIIFIIPIFVLLAAQIVDTSEIMRLPMKLFWILAAAFPAFLGIRNHLRRRRIKRAVKRLKLAGVERPFAVLFRCTGSEIKEISSLKGDLQAETRLFLRRKKDSDLRWKIIQNRFLDGI